MTATFASARNRILVKNFGGEFQPRRPTTPPPAAMSKQNAGQPLPPFQKARLRAKVGAVTCSSPWTDFAAAAAERQGVDPNSTDVAAALRNRGIYPPRPELGPDRLPRRGAVRMRRCDGCGRIVPPHNLASHRLLRLCDDCRYEPDTDADELAEQPHDARAPRAQFGALLNGVVDDNANRDEARERLHQIGLTDAQIMAMSLTYAGYSTRRVADLGRWSQTYVRKLLSSAAGKLRRSGLVVPKPTPLMPKQRARTIDPVKLDAMSDRVR